MTPQLTRHQVGASSDVAPRCQSVSISATSLPQVRVRSLVPPIAFLFVGASRGVAQITAPPPIPPRVAGYLQPRETYQSGVGLTGTLHRARLLVDGSISGGFSYRVSGEFRSGGTTTTKAGVALVDAFIRWSRATWTVIVGQFKTPFGREYLTSEPTLETADRASVSESLPPRMDIGVLGAYEVGKRGTVALGVFNGEGANSVTNRDSAVLVVGRVTARPVRALDVGANAARYGSDSTRYGMDAAWVERAVTVKAEYIGQHRTGVGADDYGWYGLATYHVRPAVVLLVKQEDFLRPAIAAARRDVATTVGTTLDFSDSRVRLYLDYVLRKIGSPGVRRGVLLTELQLRF